MKKQSSLFAAVSSTLASVARMNVQHGVTRTAARGMVMTNSFSSSAVGDSGGASSSGGRTSGRRKTQKEIYALRQKKKGRALRSLRKMANQESYMGIAAGENEGVSGAEKPSELYDGSPEAFREYWNYANAYRSELKTRELELKQALFGEAHRNPDVRIVDSKGRAHGRGTRKRAVASVYAWEDAENSGEFTVNGMPIADYFQSTKDIDNAIDPLIKTSRGLDVQVKCDVHGGGKSGQAGAIRMGVSRALLHLYPEIRAELKKHRFLTRDPREKERKKPGQKRARKKFQWAKR